MEQFVVNNKTYNVIKLLGRGKGGYSYLVKLDNDLFVLKKLHHEPCSYYEFGNKYNSEINAYKRLTEIGIRVPKLVDTDETNDILIKEYIEGPLINELVLLNQMKEDYLTQIKKFEEISKEHGYNLDYFPTNFVVKNNLIYYIDYELNEYMDKWNFDNWGYLYWHKSDDFDQYFDLYSKEIITDRLQLRKLRSSDYVDMYNNWCNNDNVTKFLPWHTHKSVNETKAFMDSIQYEYKNKPTYRWGIVYLENHKLIGMIDAWKDQEDGTPEIGYVMSEDYWNKGIMSEALQAIINYLRKQGIKRLFITADVNNIGSNKVITKNGFILDRVVNKPQGPDKPNIVSKNEYHLDL